MNYLSKDDGISLLVRLLNFENLIPIFGSGFSGNMPCKSGTVPMGRECTEKMKDLLRRHSGIAEHSIDKMDFSKASKRFKKEAEAGTISEKEYVGFFRNSFTEVKLDQIRTDVLRLPWRNVYTINIDDGIENTGIYTPILPYKNVRDDYSRKDRVYKLHGDARHEVEYRNDENIVFDQDQYRLAMESADNQTIRNNISTAFREFNIIYIGCKLDNEPDLKWYYTSVKKDKANTQILYLCSCSIDEEREEQLEEYGITDVIKINDYDSFYMDLVHEYNSTKKSSIEFPFKNPSVEITDDSKHSGLYGINLFSEAENKFNRSDILIDRSIYNIIKDVFKRNNVIVVYGRKFSGRTSLLSQICNDEKTRDVYYFPSTTAFDFQTIREILNTGESALLLFDGNSLQPSVYLGFRDLREIIDTRDHRVVIIEPLEDTYLSESIDCEIIRLNHRLDARELSLLNAKLDKYGLIRRGERDSNLDFITRLKDEQMIDFPDEFDVPKGLSKIEKKLFLLLAAQDKVYSRDLNMLGISDSELDSVYKHTGKLCERVKTSKGERRTQSSYKIIHNGRAMVLYLLQNDSGLSHEDVAKNIKELVETFYQAKDRMQRQIAISIMQFDMLNEIYGGSVGAGKLIERVYEELQTVLSDDPHYWLQRSKSLYRLYNNNTEKLLQAYRFCVKARDGDVLNDKIEAQTALSLSLISGLLYGKVSSDEKSKYAEKCILMGYKAMKSSYYSSKNKGRLEKERASRDRSYEEMCEDICRGYVLNDELSNDEYKSMAIEILRLIGKYI